MINPYTQPHRSLSMRSAEDNLKHMIRHHTRSPPSVDIVRPLLDHILLQPSNIDWTESMAKDLVLLALNLLETFLSAQGLAEQSTPDETILVLALVTAAMEEWDDDVIYMAILQEFDDSRRSHFSFLEALVQMAVSPQNQPQIRQNALIGLASACRSMDRLHQYMTLDIGRPDRNWWLEKIGEENLFLLAGICMNSLRGSPSASVEIQAYQPPEDQIQLAAISLLNTILKRDQINALEVFDNKKIVELCQHLIDKEQILSNLSHLHSPSKWYLPSSLVSSSLLTLIRWRYDLDFPGFGNMVRSQEDQLIDNVTGLAFPLAQENNFSLDTPEWMDKETMERLRNHALDVIQVWALTRGREWSTFLTNEKDWRGSIERFWKYTQHPHQSSTPDTHRMSNDIRAALLIHTFNRSVSIHALTKTLHPSSNESNDPVQKLRATLTSIYHFFDDSDSSTRLHAVSLVRALLSDRSTQLHHDDISCAAWEAVDSNFVQQLLSFVTKSSPINDTAKPLLLAFLDLCGILLQDKETCEIALGFLNAQSLEQMISLVVPTNIRFDFKDTTGWDDLSLDLASDTPPANNLSRMDENSICVEQEGELILKGIDSTLQISCATVLARLGYSQSLSTDKGIFLMKSRACKVANQFFSSCPEIVDTSSSFDTYKRFIRLQHAIARPDNEDFVTSTMFASNILSQQTCKQIRERKERAERELDEVKRRSKDLEDQVARLTSQIRSNSVIFKREVSKVIENTSQDAKQLVAFHAGQRSSAENKVMECSRQLQETQSKLQSVLLQAEESQLLMTQTKEDLKEALEHIATLESANQNLSQQIDRENKRLQELEEENRSQLHKLDSLLRVRQELEAEIQDKDRIIDDCEATNENLRINLEELFGDMVSLATIYEEKEKEVSQLHATRDNELEKTKSQLRREKEQNAELTGTIDQLREENDKLYRKVAKYKELIQNERREKEQDSQRRKRNGPVSYINQLHQSTSYSRSNRDDSSITTYNKSGRSQAHVEKENKYSGTES